MTKKQTQLAKKLATAKRASAIAIATVNEETKTSQRFYIGRLDRINVAGENGRWLFKTRGEAIHAARWARERARRTVQNLSKLKGRKSDEHHRQNAAKA